MAEIRTKSEEREYLSRLIADWNASRLDIFAISEPTEDLEYRGVMRFFFQDSGSKVATKCVRFTNRDNTEEVTKILVEKFHPDMKMLSNPSYSLYEVHPNGDARKLRVDEYPLRIQLEWQLDDREGRFLLKSDSDKIVHSNLFDVKSSDKSVQGQNLKRRLSKREKKQLKKQREEAKKAAEKAGKDDNQIAQHLYDELPETSFTRSISNPEAVMRRRRQQKLEKRLKDFQSKDSPAGGTLKIFATTLKPEIPYKTLLVSVDDTTTHVIKEALIKYQLEKEDPEEYCLVMVNVPAEGANTSATLGKERIVHDEDCPLKIAVTWPSNRGTVVFHLRRRANLPQHRRDKRRSKSPVRKPMDLTSDKTVAERLAKPAYPDHLLPYLLELSSDGNDLDYKPRIHRLQMNATDVGSEKTFSSGGNYLQLFAPHVLPRHCVITNMDGRVSVTPSSGDAEVLVNGKRIYETTQLQHGDVVKIGRMHTFRFCDPAYEKPQRYSAPAGETGSISSNSDVEVQRKQRPQSLGSTLPRHHSNSYPSNNIDDHVDIDTNEQPEGMFETTFDVSGEVKTYTGGHRETEPYTYSKPPDSPIKRSFSDDDMYDDKLPATLEFRENGEDAFFAAVISEVNGLAVHFKLAPTYTLYMCSRYRMSPHYRPDLVENQRGERLGVTILKIANMARSTIRENAEMPGSLAFWMANCSEFLHFVKQDIDISPYTKDGQQVLAQSVQLAFRHLVLCVEHELRSTMSAFLDPTDEADMEESDLDSTNDSESDHIGMPSDGRSFRVQNRYGPDGRPLSGGDSWFGGRRVHGRATVSEVIYNLSSTMSLLRRCRVNAALTIQVFSQLFHFINMWLFNKLVLEPKLELCTREWGRRISKRLARVEKWAEKQGLELAADCHLCRIAQAAHLLQAPKNSTADINAISSSCFKLNSLQMRTLLENYRPAPDEYLPQEHIERLVVLAEEKADEVARSNGQEIQREEETELQLPFLLPEDGYSCDVIRGVPPGLQGFLEPLANTGLCRLTIQPETSGLWTVYQKKHREVGVDVRTLITPDIQEVSFNKGRGGMGLSIVAAKGMGQDKLGIYIKQVVRDGPASKDGRLQAGDQILSVNGESLVGVTQEKAAEIMVKSGSIVTLKIVKQGAIYHGLATMLIQQSPNRETTPPRKLTPVEPEPEPVQMSPTLPENDIRSSGRWLPDVYKNNSSQREDEESMREGSWRQKEEDSVRRDQEEQDRLHEERMRREDLERLRREDEERRRREDEERMRREDEERMRREEEDRMRREEEERMRQEEEDRMREEEEARIRREEEDRLYKENLREEEEEKRLFEERRRQEEEDRRALRIRQEKQEEERRQREEDDEKFRIEERIQKRMEEERRIIEDERRKLAEERRQLEEERKKEDERKRTEEQRLIEQERRLEEEKQIIEEERRRVLNQRKAEDDSRRLEEERMALIQQRRAEEEREMEERRREEIRKREEFRRMEDQRRLAEERKRSEEEERLRPFENKQRTRKIRFEDEVMAAENAPKVEAVQQIHSSPQSVLETKPEREIIRPSIKASVEAEKPEMTPMNRTPNDEYVEEEPTVIRGRLTEEDMSSMEAIFEKLEEEKVVPRPNTLNYSDRPVNREPTAEEPPTSPIRVDSRDTRFGRAIVIKQGGQPSARSPLSLNKNTFDYESVAQNLKAIDQNRRQKQDVNNDDEFERWQKRQRELAEQREREAEEMNRQAREQEMRQREQEQREREQREQERREREQREREQREREQREREQREREQREKEQKEREQRERQEREKRERFEREKKEREEFEHQQRLERERLEKERKEYLEQQRIESEKAELEKKKREESMEEKRRLIERERKMLYSASQGSRETLDYIEAMDEEEVEREFQRRLEAEKKRRHLDDSYEDRRAGGLVSVTRVTYHPDRDDSTERDRKLQMIIQERKELDRERKESERRVVFEGEREKQKELQRRQQEENERQQEDWLKQQREKHEQARREQGRLRLDKKSQEDEDIMKKRSELQQRREQEDAVRMNLQRQREDAERKLAEEHKQERLNQELELQRKIEEQKILIEKEGEARRQLLEEQKLRSARGSTGEPDHVIELKERALKDYERRRILIDQEINRQRAEVRAQEQRRQTAMDDVKAKFDQPPKPVSVLKTSNGTKPKKQVSFSSMSTEFHEPSSPTYVVESSSGYAAKITPAASVRLVQTLPPADPDSPPIPRPPPPEDDDYDDDDPPPLPPPPPPEELLDDDQFPPPPRSMFNGRLSSSSSTSSSDPRSPVDSNSRDYTDVFPADYPYPINNPQLKNSVSIYGTYPRAARPVSYPTPADLDSLQFNDSLRFGGSNNNVSGFNSNIGIRQTQSLGRITNTDSSGVEANRVRMGRISLTDDSRKEPPPVAKKPETLGFKEKMKMFNQDGTPKSRVTLSRWQREQMDINGDVSYA